VELTATVAGAILPGEQAPGQDRWTTAGLAVVVLDGASAFDPPAPPADAYVSDLCATLAASLRAGSDTRSAPRASIAEVADRLHVPAGSGASSTALILRNADDHVEVTALGDSTAVIGMRDGRVERITDDRLAHVAPELRAQYRDRLRAGHGFDSTHRAILSEIQRAERASRNTPAGYWIAEADPAAADHVITRRYPASDVSWCVLATNGAQRPYDHRNGDWAALPADADPLRRHLEELQRREDERDPDGRLLPRAKRHDDKTVVVWRP
jgi:hypothetical protein